MTTNHFVAFMTGPGESGIIIAGWVGLILSLLASYLFIRAGTPPRVSVSPSQEVFKKIPVIESEKVEFSALFGIFRPIIVISPNMGDDERKLALLHEHAHAELRHNHIKLFFRLLQRLNMFNLLLQRTCRNLDLLCEYECDRKAANQFGKERYIHLLLDMIARKHKPTQPEDSIKNSALAGANSMNYENKSVYYLKIRFSSLTEITGYRINPLQTALLYITGIAPILAIVSYIFLSSIPRCAVICFLGY